MGFGMAFGVGVGTFAIVNSGDWKYLPILFWVVCLLWQIVPISMASFQEQFDLGSLLRFPVSFGGSFCCT